MISQTSTHSVFKLFRWVWGLKSNRQKTAFSGLFIYIFRRIPADSAWYYYKIYVIKASVHCKSTVTTRCSKMQQKADGVQGDTIPGRPGLLIWTTTPIPGLGYCPLIKIYPFISLVGLDPRDLPTLFPSPYAPHTPRSPSVLTYVSLSLF